MFARSGLVGKKLPFGPFQANFFHGPQTCKNNALPDILHIFLGGPRGPIHPVWGHVLVSLRFYPNAAGQMLQGAVAATLRADRDFVITALKQDGLVLDHVAVLQQMCGFFIGECIVGGVFYVPQPGLPVGFLHFRKEFG